jgi:site-specific recombinase XerD
MRPSKVHRVTVAEAADRYIDIVRAKTLTGALAPGTAEVYTRDVHTFTGLAGAGRILDDLTGEDIDDILLRFARKPDGRRTTPPAPGTHAQSGASQNRFRRSISAFFRHATVTGWVQLDPMRATTVIPRNRGGLPPERRALTREQAEGLLRTARDLATARPDQRKRADQRTELRDALIVLLLATVGPRVSELTRADIEHFYVNAGTRYWRIFGKGGPTRDVPSPTKSPRSSTPTSTGAAPAPPAPERSCCPGAANASPAATSRPSSTGSWPASTPTTAAASPRTDSATPPPPTCSPPPPTWTPYAACWATRTCPP